MPHPTPTAPTGQIIYLAGPMRGHDRFNFPAFDSAAAQLRARGHTVINPAEQDRALGFDETRHTLEDYARLTGTPSLEATARKNLESIIAATTLCLLEGWESSLGAQYERAAALYLGRGVRLLSGLLTQPTEGPKETVPVAAQEQANIWLRQLEDLSAELLDELYTGIAHNFGALLERDDQGCHTLHTQDGQLIALDSALTVKDVWAIAQATDE